MRANKRRQIGETVGDLVQGATISLEASLAHYWPSKEFKEISNALVEDHLLVHLAHTCLTAGWAVFPEAARHDGDDGVPRSRGLLDLLAWQPQAKIQLRVEAKRLIHNSELVKMVQDIELINRFELNKKNTIRDRAIFEPHYKIGLLAAIAHNEAWADWWQDPSSRTAPVKSGTSEAAVALSGHLQKTAELGGTDVCPFSVDANGWRGWILYSWWPIDP